MSAQQPSLQQRDHTMDTRKQVFSFILRALHLAVMSIFFQSQIGWPSVSSDRASWRNSLSNPCRLVLDRVWDRAQTNAPDALSILLGGNDNQGLEFCLPADCACLLSAPIGLVHLDNAI
jgi:hypothetical protein